MEYKIEEQYDSMIRAYENLRILATNIGKTAVIGDRTAVDATTSFFMNCYHFKDWLKKDSRIQCPKNVEDFISNSYALSIAADLCNSFKHAGIKSDPRSGKPLEKINMAYSLDIPLGSDPAYIQFSRNPSDGDTITISQSIRAGGPVATAKVVFTLGGISYDAIEVADECVRQWNSFLESRGISVALD